VCGVVKGFEEYEVRIVQAFWQELKTTADLSKLLSPKCTFSVFF